MNTDQKVTIEELKQKVKKFVEERDWQQYHSAKNLSMDLVAEAAELMEIFMWVDNKDSALFLENNRQEVENEVADIAFALLNFCMRYNIDLSKAFEYKIKIIGQKYPIEKCKGLATKYDKL